MDLKGMKGLGDGGLFASGMGIPASARSSTLGSARSSLNSVRQNSSFGLGGGIKRNASSHSMGGANRLNADGAPIGFDTIREEEEVNSLQEQLAKKEARMKEQEFLKFTNKIKRGKLGTADPRQVSMQ